TLAEPGSDRGPRPPAPRPVRAHPGRAVDHAGRARPAPRRVPRRDRVAVRRPSTRTARTAGANPPDFQLARQNGGPTDAPADPPSDHREIPPMTTLSVAPAPARSHGRGRHRAGRRPSHAAIELRRTWRPRRTLGDLLATATEHYCMHVVLWAALFVVFVIALYLDGAAASGAAALGTGFFRRRRTDAEQPAAQPPAGEQQPPREDPLAEPDDGLGVPELAGPDEEPPAERTDVIRAVRRDPTPSSAGATPLARIAELERQLADRDRVIARGREQLRDLEARLRNEQFDREEADRAAAVLRRALDETRPAPDAAELGARL